jgi:hypothetical protein
MSVPVSVALGVKWLLVAVERGFALFLRGCVVVLGALDGAGGFIEQRPATGEVAIGKRVISENPAG